MDFLLYLEFVVNIGFALKEILNTDTKLLAFSFWLPRQGH